tara:strand:- start:108 stop:248 length:141 start_codon:yes stop_codon:yes gene_type:complete
MVGVVMVVVLLLGLVALVVAVLPEMVEVLHHPILVVEVVVPERLIA